MTSARINNDATRRRKMKALAPKIEGVEMAAGAHAEGDIDMAPMAAACDVKKYMDSIHIRVSVSSLDFTLNQSNWSGLIKGAMGKIESMRQCNTEIRSALAHLARLARRSY
jgi:hypothetical protein